MNVLLILMPVALSLGFIGLLAFVWALRSGQFDDLEGDAYRILSDDEKPIRPQGGRWRSRDRGGSS